MSDISSKSADARVIRLGVLGCGNVGAALIQLVSRQADTVAARTGLRLEVTRVAVRNLARERDVELPDGVLTRDAHALVVDPEIDVIVEVIGGIEPARELIRTALDHGKPVVTANKELLANVGAELYAAADAAGLDLLFEAAVAGGIPLIRVLRESLRGEPIRRVLGIVNGTTNYILTKMSEDGADYAAALGEAQRLGYAERDPTADVEGLDAAAKAAIIATIAFGSKVVAGDVYHEGISQVSAGDIAVARRLGYVVKLLAICERDPDTGEVAVRVHPAMVPTSHPLASVRDSYNAVFVEGDAAGSLMFYGRGAGGSPTASAVFGDVIDAAVNLCHGTHGAIGQLGKTVIRAIDQTSAEYLLSLDVADRPGVLHAVTGVFARHGVSIRVRRTGRSRGRRAVGVHHPHRSGGEPPSDRARVARPRRRQAGRAAAAGDRLVRYVSTRGSADELGFADVLLAGLATDGGLYVPADWPKLPQRPLGGDYAAVAAAVMAPFVDGEIDVEVFAEMCRQAYATFRHPATTPLVQIGPEEWVLELFHGPTLAFKDVALQLVGRLFDHVLEVRDERLMIVGATSGDTGSAAIDGVRRCDRVDIVILYPYGRVSEVQRRQMTAVDAPNVHAIAVEGTFDDCQDLVKAMFNDAPFRQRMRLSAVNSINWARVMAQVVYYVAASDALGGRPIDVAVPTGNFGNVLAGWIAREMGAPIDRLVIGSNSNDILTRFLETGAMTAREVTPTLSPSMDIQVSSNFERLLFEMNGRDGGITAEQLQRFRAIGRLEIEADQRAEHLDPVFRGARFDDAATLGVIGSVYAEAGMLLDPHSAVGLAAGRAHHRPGTPMVALATAHPAKFPDAVEQATGVRPSLPSHLADLLDRPERTSTLPNDLAAVERFVESVARR